MNVVTFKSDWPQVWSEMRERVVQKTSSHPHLWLLGGALVLIATFAIATHTTIDAWEITRVILAVTTLAALVFLICRSVRIYFYSPQTREEKQKKFLLDLDCSLVETLEKNFESDNLDDAEIILIGETHDVPEFRKWRMEIFNQFKTNDPNNNILLAEGADRSDPLKNRPTCLRGGWDDKKTFDAQLALLKEARQAGRTYLDDRWRSARETRNKALLESLQQRSTSNPSAKIFVMGGGNHMPKELLYQLQDKKVLLIKFHKEESEAEVDAWIDNTVLKETNT